MTYEEFKNTVEAVFPGYEWWSLSYGDRYVAYSGLIEGWFITWEGRWGTAKAPASDDDYAWAESLEELRRR